jgi:hypothetical protein
MMPIAPVLPFSSGPNQDITQVLECLFVHVLLADTDCIITSEKSASRSTPS